MGTSVNYQYGVTDYALPTTTNTRQQLLKNWLPSNCLSTITNQSTLNNRGAWQASTVYALLDYITMSNGNRMKCTTAGTSGAAAPTWALTYNATTTDNTAVWTMMDQSMDVNSIAYGVGGSGIQFVAVGSPTGAASPLAGIMASTIGARWAYVTGPASSGFPLRKVVFGDKWVAVGDSDGTNSLIITAVASGATGTWTKRANAYGNVSLRSTAFKLGDGVTTNTYIAVGDANDGLGHATILKSTGSTNTSGITWVASSPTTLPTATSSYTTISYIPGSNTWCTGDDKGNIYYSQDDGVTWALALAVGGTSKWVSSYYDSYSGICMFIGPNSGGSVIQVVSSSDGVTWSVTGGGSAITDSWSASFSHQDIAGYKGIWCATTRQNHIWISFDNGYTWKLGSGSTAGLIGGLGEIEFSSIAVAPENDNAANAGHCWVAGSLSQTSPTTNYATKITYSSRK